MKDQHRQIQGYRDFTQEELDAINEIKWLGTRIGDLLGKYNDLAEHAKAFPDIAKVHVDARWLAIAKTDLQRGIMEFVRAVARPEGF